MTKLRVLFLNELAALYDAEKRIIKALPKLARAATSKQLKAAFLSHLEETKEHAVKINHVFKEFGEKPRGRRSAATIGLIKEGEKAAIENRGQPTINAALISIGQKVEHYEIASFGCLHEWAKFLRNDRVMRIIEEILTQEKTCDETLKVLAKDESRAVLDENNGHKRTPKRIFLRSRKIKRDQAMNVKS